MCENIVLFIALTGLLTTGTGRLQIIQVNNIRKFRMVNTLVIETTPN